LGALRAAGAGFAGLGEGVVAPVGDEFFEAEHGAVEVAVDAEEEFEAVGCFDRNYGDDGLEAGEDGSEGGGDWVHL
jgi:hypothetical protein